MAIMKFLLIILVFTIGSRGFVLEDKNKNPGIFKSSDIKLIKPVPISPKFNLNLPNSIAPGNRIYDINFNSFKNNLLSGKLVTTKLFKKSDDELTIVDMIHSSQEDPTSIEPSTVITEIPDEQTTQPAYEIIKETLNNIESERNLQKREPNIKVKKWIIDDHQDIPTDNLLELGESSDNVKGVLSRTQNEPEIYAHQLLLTTTEEPQPEIVENIEDNLQQIYQNSQDDPPNVEIQQKSINEIDMVNFVNNDIEATTEQIKEIRTTEEFKSMELLTDKPSVKLMEIIPTPSPLQNIGSPKSNIQRKEKIHSFSDIISNTLLAIYESQPKIPPKENMEIKETVPEDEIVGAANKNNLSSEPNYKAKSTKRSISDELNRNDQMMKNFGPTRQPAKKRTLLEKLENETSAERQERWNKSLQHMMTAVSVMGQIDKFISGRIKSGVKMVAKMYDDEDDQIRSRRNSFF